MIEEAYPDLQSICKIRGGAVDKYQSNLAALKERIRCGRNWKMLQEKFGPSILLLISSRDEYTVRIPSKFVPHRPGPSLLVF